MRLSIILPIYNVEKYLKKCLDSIINQPIRDIEIICINDCSPDNSENIILKYKKKDERIIYFKNDKNRGVGYSRNFGLENAKGEYIAFVDPDDFVDEKMFYLMYVVGIKHKSDIVECNIDKIYETDSEYENPHSRTRISDIFVKKFFLKDPVKKLEHGLTHSIWCKIYRREIVKDVKFPLNGFTDDATFNFLVMLNAKRIVKLNRSLYHYLQRDGGYTKKELSYEKIKGVVENLISIKQTLEKENKLKELKETYYELIAKFFITCLKSIIGYSSSPHKQMLCVLKEFETVVDLKTLKIYLDRYYPYYINHIRRSYKKIGQEEYNELKNILGITKIDLALEGLNTIKRVFVYVKDRGFKWTFKSIYQILMEAKR